MISTLRLLLPPRAWRPLLLFTAVVLLPGALDQLRSLGHPLLVFVCCGLGLLPLAVSLSDLVERLIEHLGPRIGGIASVVLAGLCVTVMIWLYATTSARVALMRSIADGWKRLAELMRTATMKPVHPGDLDAWRRASHLATGNLAATADLREQYAFERRLRMDAFQPVLRTLAEQQRALLLARAMAIGRFHDHPLPAQATVALDLALEAQARRLDRLSERYLRPNEVEPIATELPTAHATRATAIEAGCAAEDVARLVYRRDAIEMLARTIDRSERLAAMGFVWVDGKLESVLELEAIEAGARQPAAMLTTTP